MLMIVIKNEKEKKIIQEKNITTIKTWDVCDLPTFFMHVLYLNV